MAVLTTHTLPVLLLAALVGCAEQQPASQPSDVDTSPPETPTAAPAQTADAAPPAPPPEVTASASAAPDVPPPASAPTPAPAGKPVAISVGEPKFTAGDVPKAKASLEKLSKTVAACIDDNGGLTKEKGSVEVQFLVRASGKAEGVDVLKASGVSEAASRCVRDALKKKTIGTPSEDPIGVTVVLELSPKS